MEGCTQGNYGAGGHLELEALDWCVLLVMLASREASRSWSSWPLEGEEGGSGRELGGSWGTGGLSPDGRYWVPNQYFFMLHNSSFKEIIWLINMDRLFKKQFCTSFPNQLLFLR